MSSPTYVHKTTSLKDRLCRRCYNPPATLAEQSYLIHKQELPMPQEVLLVENSTVEARLMEHITAHGSTPVRIIAASDCSGALARLSNVRFTPNLVLADMGVLEFRGVELLRRCNPRGIPVVVFSGSVNPTDEARAIKFGVKEFVNKPLRLDDYVQAVWKIIAKWAKLQA
jgi:CheY-like chemotaxis protein